MTWSRGGAGINYLLSTPLSRSRARCLSSHNPGNDNTVFDTTHKPLKTRQRWKKLSEPVETYRLIASDRRFFACDRQDIFHHRHQSRHTTPSTIFSCFIIGIIIHSKDTYICWFFFFFFLYD
jgi:hypothetical protein